MAQKIPKEIKIIDGELLSPLKSKYRVHPDADIIMPKANGKIGQRLYSKMGTSHQIIEVGLNPALVELG